MGQIKNIKLIIVTDIKCYVSKETALTTMFLTLRLLKMKKGWRPRSLATPGRQWIGKHRRIRAETPANRCTARKVELRTAWVDRYIEFPYLGESETEVETRVVEERRRDENRRRWQRRIIGRDVYGLGTGKVSMLDHLMVTDTRRYAPVINGPISDSK